MIALNTYIKRVKTFSQSALVAQKFVGFQLCRYLKNALLARAALTSIYTILVLIDFSTTLETPFILRPSPCRTVRSKFKKPNQNSIDMVFADYKCFRCCDLYYILINRINRGVFLRFLLTLQKRVLFSKQKTNHWRKKILALDNLLRSTFPWMHKHRALTIYLYSDVLK